MKKIEKSKIKKWKYYSFKYSQTFSSVNKQNSHMEIAITIFWYVYTGYWFSFRKTVIWRSKIIQHSIMQTHKQKHHKNFFKCNPYKSKALFGHSLMQFKQSMHSVPFSLFLELSKISTSIGQTFRHLLQFMQEPSSCFTLSNEK